MLYEVSDAAEADSPLIPDCLHGMGHCMEDDDDPARPSGGALIRTSVCRNCGVRRTVDSWHTNPVDGSIYRHVEWDGG